MNKFKNVMKLSLVATVGLSTSLYSEEFHSHNEGAPAQESIEVTHSIIQNVYASKHQKRKATKGAKGDGSSDFKSLIIMNSERSSIEKNSVDSTSSAFKLSYDRDFSNSSDIGVLFSYRDTDKNRESQEISLAPYYKYYKDLAKNIDIEVDANLILETREFSGSDSIIDGYQTYGVGVTAIPGYYIGERVMLNLPIGIQNIQKSGAVDEDLHTFATYGISGEVKILENWFVNANILQTKDIDSDIEANYYVLQTNYYGEYWNFGLGYKTVENVSNYSEDTYMLSVMYNW